MWFSLAVLTGLFFVLESLMNSVGFSLGLTVLPVYYVGIRHGPLRGVLFGALVGAVTDSLAGGLLGPHMLAKGTVGILASFTTGGFFNWTPVLGVIWMFFATCMDGALSYTALAVFASAPQSLGAATVATAGRAAVNAVAGFFMRPSDVN